MALPELSGSHCTYSNIPAQNSSSANNLASSAIFTLKEALLNQTPAGSGSLSGSRHANSIWTCVGSSNGVTASLDGVDRWGTTFSLSSVNSGSSGAAHSWIILRNAANGYDLLLDMNSTTIGSARIAATPTTNPFTMNATPTRSPLAVTGRSFAMNNGSADADSTGAQWIYGTLLPNYKYYSHITFDSLGNFYFIWGRSGIGYFLGGAALVKTVNNQLGDSNNTFLCFGNASSIPWPANSVVRSTGAISRAHDNSDPSGGFTIYNVGGSYMTDSTAYADVISSEVYFQELHAFSYTPVAYRGRFANIYSMIGGRDGVIFPSPASPQFLTINKILIPFVGAAPKI